MINGMENGDETKNLMQSLDDVAKDVMSDYEIARQYMQQITHDFWPIFCAVNARPLSGKKNDNRPYIADMSLASLTRQFPRNAIQQMPAMHAIANKYKTGAPTVILDYLLRNNVLNDNSFGQSLLQKFWIAFEYASTYGFAAAYTPFTKHNNTYSAPLKLIPYADIAIEPYVMSADEASYFYITSWWTKHDIKDKIAAAQSIPGSGWVLPSLEDMLANGQPESRASQDQTHTIDSVDQADQAFMGYKVVTKFERGVSGQPGLMTVIGNGHVLRQMPILSKTGYPRIMFIVLDPDWQRPTGRSRAKLALPYWALNTAFMRAAAYSNEYNLNPAYLIKGMRGMGTIKLIPGNPIDAGDNPNADVKPIALETNTLEQAQSLIQFNTSSIQSVFGNVAGTVGSGTGNNGISRAPGFAKVQQNALDVDSNYNRRIMEDFIREYAMNALDVIVSNFSGTETILLDDQALQDIENNNITGIELDNGNEYTIDWDLFKQEVKEIDVVVDYGSSEQDDKDAKTNKDIQAMNTLSGLAATGAVSPADLANASNKVVRTITDDANGDGLTITPQQPQQAPVQPQGQPQGQPQQPQQPGLTA